jgi:threonine dehydrogenase-like Zn-dependent dehydrogenase
MAAARQGRRMGHEFLGAVEGLGPQVPGLKCGDVVVAGRMTRMKFSAPTGPNFMGSSTSVRSRRR